MTIAAANPERPMSWTPSDSSDSLLALAESMGVYPECGCEIGDCRCPDEPVLALVEEEPVQVVRPRLAARMLELLSPERQAEVLERAARSAAIEARMGRR